MNWFIIIYLGGVVYLGCVVLQCSSNDQQLKKYKSKSSAKQVFPNSYSNYRQQIPKPNVRHNVNSSMLIRWKKFKAEYKKVYSKTEDAKRYETYINVLVQYCSI